MQNANHEETGKSVDLTKAEKLKGWCRSHKRYIVCGVFLLALIFVLFGKGRAQLPQTDRIIVGHHLIIQNAESDFVLLDNNDVLASDGLYYASWTAGESKAYETGTGDPSDLYEARLYLLLGEYSSEEQAQLNRDSWLDVGRRNYDVTEEKEIICNGQTYILLLYNCKSESAPYTHGASAFGIYAQTAVCIELTCVENYAEDTETALTDFLNTCTFIDKNTTDF